MRRKIVHDYMNLDEDVLWAAFCRSCLAYNNIYLIVLIESPESSFLEECEFSWYTPLK